MQRFIKAIGCIGFLTSALFVNNAMAAKSAALAVAGGKAAPDTRARYSN